MDTFRDITNYMEKHRKVPEGFQESQWGLMSENGYGSTVAHYAIIRKGLLPRFPPEWEGWFWANEADITVASLALSRGYLNDFPPEWDGWKRPDNLGCTLAHQAGELGIKIHFPPDWDGWGLIDKYGYMVAYEFLKTKSLPEDFIRWDLKNAYGETLFETMLTINDLPWGRKPKFNCWDLVITDDGETCQEIYERKQNGWTDTEML